MAYPVEDAMPDPISPAPPFSAPYSPNDGEIAARLLARPALSAGQNARIDATATRLIEAIRGHDGGFGGVEDMLREFSLSTKEGLALMVMAEALLRVPDAATADRFIEDKLGQGDFAHHQTKSSALLVNASAWALGLSARVIQPGETPQGTLGLIGHPGDYPPFPRGLDEPVTLAIGPEGGWIPYEVDLLAKAGLQPVQLGARILRVETAVTALLSRLF